ncbi:MAG TPA: hypothetical protein VMW23_03580 [Sedimentisphaerales bacterium]|nr:hypothetical protein [Sedimentisphaerales bacterium]
MKLEHKNNGSVMLLTVFIIALFSVLVMGMLQLNTEELQLMRNQIFAAEATATAEAGLNDAFSRLRRDAYWDTGFDDKHFNGGTYSVAVAGSVPNLIITSEGISAQGFKTRVEADITIDTSGTNNHTVRIDNLRVNE